MLFVRVPQHLYWLKIYTQLSKTVKSDMCALSVLDIVRTMSVLTITAFQITYVTLYCINKHLRN